MNRKAPQASVASRDARLLKSPAPRRSLTVILLGVFAFTAALALLMAHRRTDAPPPVASVSSSAATATSAEAWQDELTPVSVGKEPLKKSSGPSQIERRKTTSVPAVAPATAVVSLPASSAYAEQLIARMWQPAQGTSQSERAKALQQQFKELTAQGVNSVPAIRQFLERNQDLPFDNSAGYPSLRAGLFDALSQIGGPEATGLMAETLRSTADPAEIALLAKTLIAKDPAQYQQDAVNAARETLDQIAKGALSPGDPGPLFQILRDYGNATAAGDLAARVPQWQYYATMALAQSAQGQGVPSLIQQVQNDQTAEGRNFALRMLAQVSGQYPDAATALAEQARANQISDRAWKQIAMGLAGDQYFFGSDQPQVSATPPLPGFKTYHIERGNQNFYSLPVGSGADISQRIAAIDQLLGATSNPTAVSALNDARTILTGMLPK